jgi:hypothetical protein
MRTGFFLSFLISSEVLLSLFDSSILSKVFGVSLWTICVLCEVSKQRMSGFANHPYVEKKAAGKIDMPPPRL